MDFSKLIRTSELKPVSGGKDEMYVDVDLPGLRNAFINIKDISGSRIEKVKNQDGKIERRLRLYGPQTDVTKTGPDGESTTTTTKQDTRIRGRQLALRVSSDAISDNWRYGTMRFDGKPDGMRG